MDQQVEGVLLEQSVDRRRASEIPPRREHIAIGDRDETGVGIRAILSDPRLRQRVLEMPACASVNPKSQIRNAPCHPASARDCRSAPAINRNFASAPVTIAMRGGTGSFVTEFSMHAGPGRPSHEPQRRDHDVEQPGAVSIRGRRAGYVQAPGTRRWRRRRRTGAAAAPGGSVRTSPRR
jgi:hypothetical protein